MERKKSKLVRVIILLILCALPFHIYSQVKIKEKVKINPNVKTLRLSKTTTDYNPIMFYFGGGHPCTYSITKPDGTVVTGSNPGEGAPISEIPIPAVNGEYHVVVTSSNCEIGYWVTWYDPNENNIWVAGYDMVFYGDQVKEDTFTFNGIPPPPPPFDFSIAFNNHLIYGRDISLLVFSYNPDSNPQDKSIALRFETIDPDVVFLDGMTQEELGNSITVSLDYYNRYMVKCKSLNSVFPKKVKVIGTSNGIVRSDTLKIVKLENIKAYFEKENLSSGDTVNIVLKRVSAQFGWESDYPDTTHFEVGLKEGCEQGNILSAAGDTAKYFRSLQQPIRFVVSKTLVAGIDSVVLQVGAPVVDEGEIILTSIIKDGVSKLKIKTNTALSTCVVKNVNKKILTKASVETSCTVYTPIYTNTSDAVAGIENTKIKITISNNDIRPANTRGTSTTDGKIKVTSGDSPLKSKRIIITINRINRSGGHDHDNSPNLNLWGRLTVNGIKGNPVTATTDNNGEISIQEILASEFGGEYFIEASLESNSQIKDKVDLKVKVDGLQILPTSSYYDKIGGTPNHYEPHNHWGTIDFINKIGVLSSLWYNKYSNALKLEINDISLPYGGLFDCDKDKLWSTPHSDHRVGKNADIKSWNMIGERWQDEKPYNGWYDKGEIILNDNGDGICDSYQLRFFRIKVQESGCRNAVLEFPFQKGKEHWHIIY